MASWDEPLLLFHGPLDGNIPPQPLREACRYLEQNMGYRTPGMLWSHVVDARPTGGNTRAVRLPRPLALTASS